MFRRFNPMMVALLLLLAVVLAGCDAANAPTAAGAKAAVCQGITAVQAAVGTLASVDANTRVSEVQGAKQKLDTAVEALRRANEVLKNENVTQIITSYESLSQSISQVANQETLGAAAGAVQGASASVIGALNQASSALQCRQ